MVPSQRRALVFLALALAPTLACHSQRSSRPQPATETVAGGYGEKSQASTAQSVNIDEKTKREVNSIEELLETLPSVEVRRATGGGYSVIVRGVGSFQSSEQALFVVDGVPQDLRGGRGLSWLHPSEVERISVLKNPADIAIYGVRGANGVIVITTKRKR